MSLVTVSKSNRKIQTGDEVLVRDHSFSTCAKFSEKHFLNPLPRYVRVRISVLGGKKC